MTTAQQVWDEIVRIDTRTAGARVPEIHTLLDEYAALIERMTDLQAQFSDAVVRHELLRLRAEEDESARAEATKAVGLLTVARNERAEAAEAKAKVYLVRIQQLEGLTSSPA